jgi:hypothetical protein
MEQHTLKNVSNCLKTNIYSYLETSGGQSSNPYLIAVLFSTPELIRSLWQLKTAVFLHWCLLRAVPLHSRERNVEEFTFNVFQLASSIWNGLVSMH